MGRKGRGRGLLTRDGSLDPVLVCVLGCLASILGAWVSLVTTEGLPLLAHTIFVVQVVLHVTLWRGEIKNQIKKTGILIHEQIIYINI